MLLDCLLLCGISCTFDPPPLNCSIHLPTTVVVVTFGPCTHFNCLRISAPVCPILVKNRITSCTAHAKYSFKGTSIFACAYFAFYWSVCCVLLKRISHSIEAYLAFYWSVSCVLLKRISCSTEAYLVFYWSVSRVLLKHYSWNFYSVCSSSKTKFPLNFITWGILTFWMTLVSFTPSRVIVGLCACTYLSEFHNISVLNQNNRL